MARKISFFLAALMMFMVIPHFEVNAATMSTITKVHMDLEAHTVVSTNAALQLTGIAQPGAYLKMTVHSAHDFTANPVTFELKLTNANWAFTNDIKTYMDENTELTDEIIQTYPENAPSYDNTHGTYYPARETAPAKYENTGEHGDFTMEFSEVDPDVVYVTVSGLGTDVQSQYAIYIPLIYQYLGDYASISCSTLEMQASPITIFNYYQIAVPYMAPRVSVDTVVEAKPVTTLGRIVISEIIGGQISSGKLYMIAPQGYVWNDFGLYESGSNPEGIFFSSSTGFPNASATDFSVIDSDVFPYVGANFGESALLHGKVAALTLDITPSIYAGTLYIRNLSLKAVSGETPHQAVGVYFAGQSDLFLDAQHQIPLNDTIAKSLSPRSRQVANYDGTWTVEPEPVEKTVAFTSASDVSIIKGAPTLLALLEGEQYFKGEEVTWTSSNTKIVTVDKYGNITGLRKGSATITATSPDGLSFDSAVVYVENAPNGKPIKK